MNLYKECDCYDTLHLCLEVSMSLVLLTQDPLTKSMVVPNGYQATQHLDGRQVSSHRNVLLSYKLVVHSNKMRLLVLCQLLAWEKYFSAFKRTRSQKGMAGI